MLSSADVVLAVSRILQRSERQEDLSKLIGTYVDVGILPQLDNDNHQIIYGRRGTGKTHVLKVLEKQLRDAAMNTVVYIDARTLGSSAQYLDPGAPMHLRCLSLFRDIIQAIQAELLEHLVNHPSERAEQALDALGRLGDSVRTDTVQVDYQVTKETTTHNAGKAEAAVGVEVSQKPSVHLSGKVGSEAGAGVKTTETYKLVPSAKIFFPEVHVALGQVLQLGATRLYVLIDEWASLPLDIQPYLAEFLKRSVLPVPQATLKIAALEHRSAFSLVAPQGRTFGFEVGADISTATDLDDYLVFDRNPQRIASLYADILYRHMNSELPANRLEGAFGIVDGASLVDKLFVDRYTFVELARASEGVVRDLINIFTAAFFDAQKRGKPTIDKRAVIDAARNWYERDKAAFLDEGLRDVLRKIVEDVIGRRHARSFMLPRELQTHPVIQRLFDLRVLHQMQKGYADKDKPGVRYNIYTLDYGTYVDLRGTKTGPDADLIEQVGDGWIVPFDDKRSIRRIILGEEVLSADAKA